MLKHFSNLLATLGFCVLTLVNSFAQTSSSGTIGVLWFDGNRILVGVDSRGATPTDADPLAYTNTCKVITLGKRMFFVPTGLVKAGPRDNPSVDAFSEAEIVYEQASKKRNTAARTANIAKVWGDAMVRKLKGLARLSPFDFPADTKGILITGFFGAATDNGQLAVYAAFIGADFKPQGTPPNITFYPRKVWRELLPWPNNSAFPIGFFGSESPGVSEFVQNKTERSIQANIVFNDAMAIAHPTDIGAFRLNYAIKSAEEWAVHKNEAGGDVDILELKAGGDSKWLQVKKECAEQH